MPENKASRKPWPRARLEQHVRWRIRDYAECYRDGDGALLAALNGRGEDALWRAIIDAIEEAGWRIVPTPDQ